MGGAGRGVVFAGGVLFLALPLWRPDWFYPLVWGATALLLAPWNHARDPGSSLLGDVERGRYGRIVRLLLAGLAIYVLTVLYGMAAAVARHDVPGIRRSMGEKAKKVAPTTTTATTSTAPMATRICALLNWLNT